MILSSIPSVFSAPFVSFLFRVILANRFNFSVLYPPSSHYHKPCLGKHKAASIFQHSKLEEMDSQRQMTMESCLHHGALPFISATRFSLSPSGKCQVFFLFMSPIFSRYKSVRLKRPGISHRIRNRHDREPIILVQHTCYRSFLLYLLTQFH